jgi:hypothetical protein
VRWGKERLIDRCLHSIVARLHFQMQPVVTSVCPFSPTCCNFILNSAAAGPGCAIRNELCTAYVVTFHVPLLSYNDMYIYIHTHTHTSCHSSHRTWRWGCSSFLLVMVKLQPFQVKCAYIQHFCLLCYQGDTVSDIG